MTHATLSSRLPNSTTRPFKNYTNPLARTCVLGHTQRPHPEIPSTPPIEVIERIAHAPRLGPPELCIQRLDLLQFGVCGGRLGGERYEDGVLCLQGGGDR